jgi:hypothetical protein
VLCERFCFWPQVSLSSGENRIVTMSMSDKDLSIWDSSLSKWSRWHGQFTMCESISAAACIAALLPPLTQSAQLHRRVVAGHQADPHVQRVTCDRTSPRRW